MNPAEEKVPDHDPQQIAALVDVVGASRLQEMFGQLAAQIAAIDSISLAPTLHRLRGTSASLGLSRLAAEIATMLVATDGIEHPDLAQRVEALEAVHAAGVASALAAIHAAGASNE